MKQNPESRKSIAPLTVLLATLALVPAHGAISLFSLSQSDTAPGSVNTDLTSEGNLDWGIFAQGPGGQASFDTVDKPYESKLSGVASTSLNTIGGANWNTGASFTLTFSQRVYSWTDGTVVGADSTLTSTDLNAFGRVLTHDGAGTGFAGAGTRLTVDLPAAGTYTLTYYAATFNLALDGVATLQSEGVPFTQFSPVTTGIGSSGLDDYVLTVDFVTTGADTLTLDVVNSSTTAGGAYALEAYTLSGTVVPEPSSLGLALIAGCAAFTRRRRA